MINFERFLVPELNNHEEPANEVRNNFAEALSITKVSPTSIDQVIRKTSSFHDLSIEITIKHASSDNHAAANLPHAYPHITIKDKDNYLIKTSGFEFNLVQNSREVYRIPAKDKEAFNYFYDACFASGQYIVMEVINDCVWSIKTPVREGDGAGVLEKWDKKKIGDLGKSSSYIGRCIRSGFGGQGIVVNNNLLSVLNVWRRSRWIDLGAALVKSPNDWDFTKKTNFDDFEIFGENEDTIVRVNGNGVIQIAKVDFKRRKLILKTELKMKMSAREKKAFSLSVCPRSKYLAVYSQVNENYPKIIRIFEISTTLNLKLKADYDLERTYNDRFGQLQGFCFYGYLKIPKRQGELLILSGVTSTQPAFVVSFGYDVAQNEIREFKDLALRDNFLLNFFSLRGGKGSEGQGPLRSLDKKGKLVSISYSFGAD